MASRIARQLAAGVVMAAALWAIRHFMGGWFSGSFGHRLVGVVALVGGGMAVYFPLVYLFGGLDKVALKKLLRRKKPVADAG